MTFLQPEMIRGNGYTCEEHRYTTSDGYINMLHRIPHGRKTGNSSRGAVFLQHGLMGTSADFIMGSPEKSLGIWRHRKEIVTNTVTIKTIQCH